MAEHAVGLIVAVLAAARITGLLQTDKFAPVADLRGFILSHWPGAQTKFYRSEAEGDDTYGWKLRVSGRTAFREVGDEGLDEFYVVDPHPIGELWECPRCLGYWVSLAVFCGYVFAPLGWWLAVMVPLAMSQLVVWLLKLD